jgi:DNA polymerase (family 10)
MAFRNSRIPLGRADALASQAIREAQQSGLAARDIVRVGGLRRCAPAVEGAVLVAIVDHEHQPSVLHGFTQLSFVRSVLGATTTNLRVITERGLLEIHTTSPEEAGAALVWHTGTRRHTKWLQARATARGLTFTDGRLRRNGGPPPLAPDEETFYQMLGLPFIPPELREGEDEIAAAERGDLPSLIDVRHIRGDLHMHSSWSDGRDSILQMALAARELGYEYIALTDHSERSWASRRLLAVEIPLQRQEIEAVRAQVPGLEILHGVEVDIMPDGSLDFDDETLSQFDIVLASLHDAADQKGAQLTQRYLQAMWHPLVTIITHPANRTPAITDGYDLDYQRLFRAAIQTNTAMEIDGAPGHLDMDGRIARQAAAAGVTLTVNSDCHRAEALGRQMSFGVGTARRGWVAPYQVLNTRGIDGIRAFIARKRGRARRS